MFQFLSGLIVLATLVSNSAPSFNNTHGRTVRITIKNPDGESSCGATAISKHALLTARHCLDDMRGLAIDGSPTKVLLETDDDGDHSLIVVDGTFTHYISFTIINPHLGEPVYIFGNPGKFRDLLRKGYVAGTIPPDKNRDFSSTVYDFNGFFGDSGSAIFNEKGQIVGVVSYIIGRSNENVQWKIMASNPINFTLKQIETVENYQ